jgi:hypothetical protein
MRVVVTIALLSCISAGGAQQRATSPTDAALRFYRALKNKQYVEGFRHSVYRGAVEGLTQAELSELEPDFARTFSQIPDKIEPRGEQITGDSATVFLKFDEDGRPQEVGLVRVDGEWLVGDQDSLTLVRQQGRAFFFNTRILVNEGEAFEMLSRIVGAEIIYAQRFDGRTASLQDLIRLGGVPKDLDSGEVNGYRFTLNVSADQKSFSVVATPVVYGRSGRLSFYADANGIRAEDKKGQPASQGSPAYQPK